MKKRLFSILLALCMVLCLVPTTAFAESETEETPVCTCETVCTAEAMNAECPVCGAEGALAESCGKYTEATAEGEVSQPDGGKCEEQPKGEPSEVQIKAPPVLLSGEGEQSVNGTEEEIDTSDKLTAAIANGGTVKLMGDINITSSLEINSEVTLDLNGHSLQMTGSGSAIIVANGAKLTLKDSSPETTHKFRKDGHLLTLDENGSETVKGGVITGGTGTLDYKFTYGGCVNVHGVFAMEGGTIVGGQATYGGGVYSNGQFIMNGGTIKGCSSSASGQYAAIYIGGGEMLANDGMIEGTGALKGTIKTDTGKGGTTFSGHIKFYSPCIIEGGNFTGYAENWSGTIKGGTFSGTVSGGKIQGGNFVVRFDLNDGTPAEGENYANQTIAFQSQVTQPASPSKIGYTFDGWYIGDSDNKWDFEKNTVSAPMTLKAKWTDAEEPTGEIDIGTNKWHELLNNITFELFFKDTQTVAITASDNSGETVTIEYLLSDKALTEAELANSSFTAYTAPFGIDPDNEYIIYVKLTDTAGNSRCICSEGIVLDATDPEISGIENGKTYCEPQTVTIAEKYVDTVTVNGTVVTLDENNSFSLAPTDGEQKIVVTDKAGNTAEMTVTVNDGHTYEWQSENGEYWQKCKFCGNETMKKLIPEIVISGADRVCRTQDYAFSLKLPEGGKLITTGYEFEKIGGDLTATLESGKYTVELASSGYPAEENGFKVTVSAETADGFAIKAEKSVTILNDHTGGKATCKDKAKCEVCGAEYGELDAKNHTDLKHFPAKAATKTAEGNIEYWYCEGCGKYFSDRDGTKEIKKADTITAKLKDDSKSPQTGDTSNLALWIALLFISGGAAIGTTVVSRKKKYNR